MKHWIYALGAMAMMTCGCDGIVIDTLQRDPPAEGGGGGGDGNGESATPSAMAMSVSRWKSSPVTGGLVDPSFMDGVGDDDLVLFFASGAQSCAQPVLPLDTSLQPDCNLPDTWQAILVLPAGLVQPGVIDLGSALDDGAIRVYWGLAFSDCSGGGGTYTSLPGTLEILSAGETALSMKLSASFPIESSAHETPDPSGDYTAAFCP